MQKRILLGLAPMLLLLSACSPSVEATHSFSEGCEAAVVQALEDEQELFNTHPAWVNDPPNAEVGTPEFEQWDEWVQDEEIQWEMLMLPVYETCSSPEEWFAVAQKHPGVAGVTGSEFIQPYHLEAWCHDRPDLPACRGFDDWAASFEG